MRLIGVPVQAMKCLRPQLFGNAGAAQLAMVNIAQPRGDYPW
jgi:hypothetical protein